jgi:general secretion pathway protein G
MIEMLVIVTLVVILASMAMVNYRTSVQAAKEAVLKENLFRMNAAIDQYYTDRAKYPASLEDLVTEGYIREIPKDPFTQSKDTWVTTLAAPDPNNPAAIGIFAVKSGSDLTAINGTRYSEWQ